jgi:hypothetical protein
VALAGASYQLVAYRNSGFRNVPGEAGNDCLNVALRWNWRNMFAVVELLHRLGWMALPSLDEMPEHRVRALVVDDCTGVVVSRNF